MPTQRGPIRPKTGRRSPPAPTSGTGPRLDQTSRGSLSTAEKSQRVPLSAVHREPVMDATDRFPNKQHIENHRKLPGDLSEDIQL